MFPLCWVAATVEAQLCMLATVHGLQQCVNTWWCLCRWLGTPKLVRDTSRRWFWQRRAQAAKSSDEVKKDFSDIVLPHQMHDHVRALAAVTSNTKRHGAPFRHMLFYG